MAAETPERELIIGVTPFGEPNARLVAALCRAGALGVLDLGRGDRHARHALDLAARWTPGTFGVRVAPGCALRPEDLPLDRVDTVVLADGAPWTAAEAGPRVLVEVTSPEQARAAVAAGAHGLIARGHEAGGKVGELSSFVLVQKLVAEFGLPVWVNGGIGPRTATAAVVGGAAGVVLDSQLALLAESDLAEEVTAALSTMDGSETVLVGGHRVLLRRGPGAPATTDLTETEVIARLGAKDLREQLLPVGQDGFLAKQLADRFGSATALVRGLRAELVESLRSNAGADALCPGAPLAAALGVELPIAQGPMTRVSDQAAFAKAVAEGGAMPFLALALAGKAQTRALLEETRDLLGERPWGVGVLGFAPEDVRAGQLEVIQEIKPACAIIAGGRPAQANALEDNGIAALLHVPSPGLLRQFLEAGARRFIFEGQECGGHVGPRSSFPLWEAQISVLLDYLSTKDGQGIQVLFAGGVHDERSAAMVTAMAAPLTERGVAIGVLMGTAYLFTEEAVAAGAVQPAFQRQVIAAERTELLETAPGHATRCVTSPFAEEFLAIKDELRTSGVPDREAWEKLEQLNVGRLRIASKGVTRDGDKLVEVAEAGQLADGMFMAGQVAVLRSAVTTVADLHASVSSDAAAYLTTRLDELAGISGRARAEVPAAPPVDVAIVGMACMFPGAADLPTYWANVVGGRDAVTEVPGSRWDHETYYSPDATGRSAGEKTPSKWGGFLPEIPFDPLSYGIPPASLAAIEPVQLLALEAAQRSLVDAGYTDRAFDRSRVGVVFGAEAGSDLSNASSLRAVLPGYIGEIPAELDAQLPKLTEDSFPGMLANVISGRIANRLDLGGANYTVDAACASSLAALDVACKELVSGSADMMLCGGADLHNGINDYLLFSSVHALSPTGQCRTFDGSADGIALGEGVACVALKRLEDAERDGDRVYGVIKGVGAASDGKSLGLTAPRPEGQRNALERAYANARISPAEVGLVEAHGTGTVVGDRTELGTLTKMFVEHGALPGTCTVGSVKSQIGHTKCAAGLAGLIKAALALHTGIKPPTLHVSEPNAAWQPDSSPFTFTSAALPWEAEPAERVAGVSAFGFGGTNFHVVLRGYDGGPAPRHVGDQWPAELFTFRGADLKTAGKHVEQTLELLRTNDSSGRPWRLRDIARTVARRSDARTEPVQIAVVASDLDDLAQLLRSALAGETPRGVHLASVSPEAGGKVAFLFPGQGSQKPGMLADLFVAFPEVHHLLHEGRKWASTIFPPTAFDEQRAKEQDARLRDTRVAQPALGIAGLAVHQLLSRLDVRPDMVAGHSYGELIALAAAGSMDSATLLRLSEARADSILGATGDDPGAMAAVKASRERVTEVLTEAGLAEEVVAANHNSPEQLVISGPTAAIDAAVAALKAAKLSPKKLNVACAFHSPLVSGATETFGAVLADADVRAPELPVYANRTAAVYSDDVRAELAAQIGSPVRFVEQIEAMYADGARIFVEAGPGKVLTNLVKAILGDRPHLTVACEGRPRHGLAGLLNAVATLAVSGVGVRTGWLFAGRDAKDLTNAKPPKRAGWTIDGHVVRTASGDFLPNGLAPARRVEITTMTTPGGSSQPGTNRDAMVNQFLQASREMVQAQRDVLLTYLGSAPEVQYSIPAVATVAPVQQYAAPAPAVVEAAPVSAAPAAQSTVDVLGTVLEIISERTGYPLDMIEPDLDLEADLSIDSIKRTEIAGELASRIGAADTQLADDQLEELAKARTAQAISDWLSSRVGSTAPAPAAAAPAPVQSTVDILGTVLEIISERTGYPLDMIEPDLDLEADLSIDSIKRTEIAGELASRIGATDAQLADEELEELAKARTAQAIADWLGGHTGSAAPAATSAKVEEPVNPGIAPKRLVMAPAALDAVDLGAAGKALGGKNFLLFGTGPVSTEVAALLGEHGAAVSTSDTPRPLTDADGSVDGVLHLDGWDEVDEPVLPETFPSFKSALTSGLRWLISVSPTGGGTAVPELTHGRAAGLRGFFRTVQREYPDTVARLVEVDHTTDAAVVAKLVLAELLSTEDAPVVLATPDSRHGLVMTELPLTLGSTGAGPAGDGAAEAQAIGLDRDSVVLLIGGARGITAQFASTLASASGCRIELVGRTAAATEDEDPKTAAATDKTALRKALIELGHRSPAEIEKLSRKILAQREVAATVEQLRELGSQVRYHSLDVRDHDALRQLVKEIHTEHGRIDGVVYAAGVIEDKLLAEKDVESFRRVFNTKVGGARALLGALEELPTGPGFVTLFGSIAAVLGNRGQSDYSSANDALEAIGAGWAGRTGNRAVTVHWGPWAPSAQHGGMVTVELQQEYARRGISLIDPEEGTMSLLRELAFGAPDLRAVVYTASGW
ncbi:SDR family NAD(P)-dependent oxidoreductase [Allokutzneria sp. A3M-2-11 16]|uniref:type I polyketide synthase n=1 Tax=Allokutzneria sp. A3M-2-11 16 TaxID=2962043 RepID=UPI0020B77224|nr:type I polyketide synthase [Allokutzneria sp. A3M-2-11 16]MCP3802450.1 SDR family NAD(P)-dependent oxidoreductase [Allokutzneria sp. A3M-2-11 16]